MRARRFAVAASAAGCALLIAVSGAHAAGSPDKGAVVFVRQCALCHTIAKGAPNRFGPNLFGITERKAGTAPGYAYSPQFLRMANWTCSPDGVASFVVAPGLTIPGNKMSVFPGVADATSTISPPIWRRRSERRRDIQRRVRSSSDRLIPGRPRGTPPPRWHYPTMAPRSVPHSRRQYVHHLNTPALAAARELPEAEESRFPKFIPPALATLVPRPPRGAQWVHEIKYDGYRFQCHIHRDVRFLTRRGYDWSDRLGHLVTALAPLTSHAVVLDGEVIVETPEGRSDFHALEKELKAKRPSRRLVYYVFDLLYLDAFDLRRVPLIDRKRVLELVLADVAGPVRLSEHLTGDGADVFRRACDLELEGIVSKRMDAAYASGRTDAWTKVTCRHRETLAVVGWAEKDRKFDGIYLARPRDHGLIYAGKLERGFSDDDKAAMLKRLAPLRARTQPMKAARKNFPKAHWVRPQVLVDAEFRGLTGDGLLRHPSFKGVREDLS